MVGRVGLRSQQEVRGLGSIKGLAGVWGIRGTGGFRGPAGGVRGVRGQWSVGRWTGCPTTLGPSPGSQHSHWFPLGSDLPGQGQASDRNELCRLLYTFDTTFLDSLHTCIYAA